MTTPVEIAEGWREARRRERAGLALDGTEAGDGGNARRVPRLTHVDDPGPPEPPDDGPSTSRLAERALSRSAIANLPAPQPLIANMLDRGTQALIYGRWGSGKSFIALDLALCVATGKVWQGRRVEQQRVLYVAAEGAFGYRGRLDAWETGFGMAVADEQFTMLPEPVNLTRPTEVGELRAYVQSHGFGLVVIDTLSRCMVGADENSAKDCGQVVDALHKIRQQTPGGRGVVLSVHHAGKDGKTFRGSSVFEAGADTVYSVVMDGRVIVLDREKRKDGPREDRHELKIDPMPGTDSACISVHRGGEQTDRANKLLSTFVQNFGSTGATKAELRLVADMDPATFFRAVNDLLKSGSLVNTGGDKRPFYELASKS